MENTIPKTVNLLTCANPYNVQLTSDVQTYTFYNATTYTLPGGGFSIAAVGTPTEGMTIWMMFLGTIVTGANVFNILGTNLNVTSAATAITANPFVALCIYSETGTPGWHVTRLPLAPIIASAIFTTDAYGNLTIANTAVTNAMLAGSIAYAKLSLAGTLLNTDLHATFAMPLAQLAASTFNVIPKFGSTGLLEPTATTPTQLSYCDFTSSGQAQITAVANDLASNYTDDTALAALFASYYTSATIDGFISSINASIAAATVSVLNYTSITGNTIFTTSTLKNSVRIDVTSGAVQATLPAANSVAAGRFVEFTQIAAGGAATIVRGGADTITDTAGASQTTITIGGAGKSVSMFSDGSSVWFIKTIT